MLSRRFFMSIITFCFPFYGLAAQCLAETTVQNVTAVAPTKDPIGWWKFDGDCRDSAGSNHGVKTGETTYGAGVFGQAISFDGVDDFIVIKDNGGSATIEYEKGSFSIAFWLKSNFVGVLNSGVEECIIRNGTDGTEFDSGGMSSGSKASGKRYVIKFKHNKFRFVVDDNSKHILAQGGSSNFATGDWINVIAVRDTAANALRLYCNGQLVNTTVDTTGDISSPDEPLFIGAKQKEDAHAANPAKAPMDNYFKGMLDDLMIYNYALTQAEIANIMGLSSIQVSPPSAESLFNIARQYEQAEIYTKAQSLYQQIVEQYPDSPEADNAQLDIPKTQILLLFVSGQNGAAQAAIDELIADFSQHPYLPEMLYGIAKEYQDSDEFERAITIYQKIATQCSSSDYAVMAQTNIILSYISMGRISESNQALNKLSQEFQGHTDFPKALYEVAEPYKKAGESRQAEALYKTIVTNYPDTIHAFKSQKKLTTLYIESGRDAEVQQSFNKMVTNFSKYPDLASALEHIAGKYEMADNLQQAKNIYQKIAIDYPDTDYALQAQKNLGVIYVEEGNDIAAQELIDKLIVDFNDHPALTDAISRIIEGYYYRILESESWLSENYQRPIRMWEKVLKKFPGFFHDEPDLYYFIGDCYRHLGEYENAMQYYGTVAANWTDDGYAVLSQVVVPTAKDDNTAGAYDALHEAIDSLIADFGDHPGLAGVVLRSAHGYRRRANDAQRQGLTGEAAVDNFNAVVLYDRVINEFPSSPFVASSYFFSALAYRDLGQWQDALDCCNRLLDNWPGYKYAPWAQRLAQDCSERLAGQAQ